MVSSSTVIVNGVPMASHLRYLLLIEPDSSYETLKYLDSSLYISLALLPCTFLINGSMAALYGAKAGIKCRTSLVSPFSNVSFS